MPTWSSAGLGVKSDFRVFSYNVLSQHYAQSAKHDYCPANLRTWEVRFPKLLTEILGADADVVCLQEVTVSAFRRDFKPALSKHGYKAYLSADLLPLSRRKGRHFLATFVRVSTFSSVCIRGFCLRDYSHHGWMGKKLWKKLRGLNDGILVCRLSHKSGREVIVANIHVFYDPAFPQVKTCQVHTATWAIQTVKGSSKQAPVVFCGDFNATPLLDRAHLSSSRFPTTYQHSGVYALLTAGKLSPDHPEHPCHYGRSTSVLREFSGVPVLRNRVAPFCDAYSSEPADSVTTQTDTFRGRIDYVFYEQFSGLRQVDQLVLPPASVLGQIPNTTYPSDHVSIGAAFVFEGGSKETSDSHRTKAQLSWLFCLGICICVACLLAAAEVMPVMSVSNQVFRQD